MSRHLLWGVAFANIVRGVPIDAEGTYTGGFFNLLNPYALLGGAGHARAVHHPRRDVPGAEDDRRRCANARTELVGEIGLATAVVAVAVLGLDAARPRRGR